MKCEEAKIQFADVLTGADDATTLEFEEHVRICSSCREELDTLRTHWAALGLLNDVEPGPGLKKGFYNALEAYQHGLTEKPHKKFWLSWWSAHPALQAALSVALLIAGVGIGHFLTTEKQTASPEISQLRGEINSMRQMVTLSLLQQQSASDRLKGVTWAYRVEQSDMEVLGALLQTINQDPNIDVRLAAVDAIRAFGSSPVARRGLIQSLPKQASPLMQIAVIDVLVELRVRQAAPAIEQLMKTSGLDENVTKRAQSAMRQLE